MKTLSPKQDVQRTMWLHGFKVFCQSMDADTDLNDLNWYDVSIGWFMARGCDKETAFELAGIARYEHGYWV